MSKAYRDTQLHSWQIELWLRINHPSYSKSTEVIAELYYYSAIQWCLYFAGRRHLTDLGFPNEGK